MAIPSNIGKCYVKQQVSWGTAAGSWAAADLISAEMVLPELVQEALTSKVFRGSWGSFDIEAGAKDGTEFQVQHVLQGTKLTTPSANPTVGLGEGAMLASVLGGAVSIGYKAAIAGSGQSNVSAKYTNGDLSSDWVGQAVILPVVAQVSGRQWAWAKTIDTASTPDALEPWFGLDGSPTNGGPSFGSAVYFASLTQPTPFTVRFLLGDGSEVLIRDCVCPSSVLDLVAGKQPRATYGVKAGLWTVTAAQWTPAAYADNYPELPILGAENGTMYRGYIGVAGLEMPSVKIEMTAAFERAGDLASTGGFAKYIVTDRAQKMTVVELLDTVDNIDAIVPGSSDVNGCQLDLCTTPGRAASIFAPEPQAKGLPKMADANGLITRTTEYDFRPPTTAETPAGGTCAIGSEFRVALG